MANVIRDLNLSLLVVDRRLANEIVEERRKLGHDRRDEIWNGVYRISSPRDNLHSQIASDLCAIFVHAIDWSGCGEVRFGVNISDRRDNWLFNIRIPSVCVMLSNGCSENCGDFWLGGPDFVVEISTLDEDLHEKIAFYQSVGVRELLIIERKPWKIELYRLDGDKLKLAESAETGDHEIVSEVIPFGFQFVQGENRPGIAVRNARTGESRTI